MDGMLFLQHFVNGILAGGLYGLIGVAFVIINKSTNVFNFAVGSMFAFGGYLCVSSLIYLHLPFGLAVLIALGLSAVLGALVERLCLRPLLGQPILSLLMATLAADSIIYGITLMIWTGYTISFPRGILPVKALYVGSVFLSQELLFAFIVAMISFILIGLFFYKTHIGLKMRVTAGSHGVAMSLGINITRIFSMTWMIAAMVGSVAGMLIGNRLGLQPSITPTVAFKAFPAIIFGGLDSVAGAIVGGLIVGVLEKMAGGYIDPKLSEITPYIILLLMLLIKPEGLFGQKSIGRI